MDWNLLEWYFEFSEFTRKMGLDYNNDLDYVRMQNYVSKVCFEIRN